MLGSIAMHLFWQVFGDAPPGTRVLGALQLALTIWMLVDAYQRRVEFFWYWIILLFQPIGAWVYFFAVKFRTLRWPGRRPAVTWERKLSLDELRYRVERTPTVANRLALAERLIARGEHAEAVPHLESILAIESDYLSALHALAECRVAMGHPEQALAPLEKLMKRDPQWANYRAWGTLIAVRLARHEPAEALKACRELERRVPSLENKCLLAEHLLDNGLPAEVLQLLDQALQDHHYAAWSIRWRNWSWARQARKLIAEAEKQTPSNNG